MAAPAQDNAAQEADEKRIFEPEDDEGFDKIMETLKGKLVIIDMMASWCVTFISLHLTFTDK